MRKIYLGFVCAVFAAPAAFASVEKVCVDVISTEGGDTSDCACLAAQADGDYALSAELIALADLGSAEERYDAASPDAQAAIEACFPPPGA